jgi:Tol biopolymer transport system component
MSPLIRHVTALMLVLTMMTSIAATATASHPASHGEHISVARDLELDHLLHQMPLYFIENRGQVDDQVAYYVEGRDKTLHFTSESVTFVLTGGRPESHADLRPPSASTRPRRWVLRLEFVDADPGVLPTGQDETGAVISYFKGQPEDWKAGLKTYSMLVYPDLWPGIDLVYSGTVNLLKYQFVVHPGADPSQIRLAYRGATSLKVSEGGQLRVSTPVGGLQDDAPYAYQETQGGHKVEVPVGYALETPERGVHTYGFDIGDYDPALTLLIDPALLVYCGYIGGTDDDYVAGIPGSAADWYYRHGIAVDGAGSAYVTGFTKSTPLSFPVSVGPDLTHNRSIDAFVAKLSPDGTRLQYCGYIGGDLGDYGHAIAVDSMGNAYVTGATYSSESDGFPVTVGPGLTHSGNYDVFVAKVGADGTQLVYCGYIGGDDEDQSTAIALDSAGSAYVAGLTWSTGTTFPVSVGPDLTHNGRGDAFVAKVWADGTGLGYCGYIGAGLSDVANGIAVDGSGCAYLTGSTPSSEAEGFPVVTGPDLTYNGGLTDAYVAKVSADGTALVSCGYIGGGRLDRGTDIAVDGSGDTYVVGFTESSQPEGFPVEIGPDLTHNGGETDAFVARVRADGTSLAYCGYIGGDGQDHGLGIALDADGNGYVTGYTYSSEATFPVTVGPNMTHSGGVDAFVARVNGNGRRLDYCGYIGGIRDDYGYGVAVDSGGNAYVAGHTESSDSDGFPVTVGPDLTHNGSRDVFVAKISALPETPAGLRIYLPIIMRGYSTLCNGGFETGDWSCWSHGGELNQQIVTTMAKSGRYSALLGDPTYDCWNRVPLGRAWVSQRFTVPRSPATLSFWYRLYSQDQLSNDSFDAYINGVRILHDGNTTPTYGCNQPVYDSGWIQFTYDLSMHEGQSIELRFENVTREDGWFNTWTYVDEVQVSVSGPTPTAGPSATATPSATGAPSPTPSATTTPTTPAAPREGNGTSNRPRISADGRCIVFVSEADNLVPGDTNGVSDVFVHDLQTGQTERVSIASDGTQGSDVSGHHAPSISSDGRYVAFDSTASNLVPGDTNECYDVFVHDRQTGETTRVSMTSEAEQGDGPSHDGIVSADGRYVAYRSMATNLPRPGGNNDIFVHDRETGQTSCVSLDYTGWSANSSSDLPSISADGRYVVFISDASDLIEGDTNGVTDAFVHDRLTGQTRRVSIASDGSQANGRSASVDISLDGRFVAFKSEASNLVPNDTNDWMDVFVHDIQTGTTTRVSVSSGGVEGEKGAATGGPPDISGGRYVAFGSLSGNLIDNDQNGQYDVFVHDCLTGETELVSAASDGRQGNHLSSHPGISADGRYVTFQAFASNLVDDDTNGVSDVFVHDRLTGETIRTSVSSYAGGAAPAIP